MKKVFAVLAVVAMLVAVAACGNKKAEEAPVEEEVVEQVVEETVEVDTTAQTDSVVAE
ncbi:MAG: hypothetical protein MJY61_06065 [Bacteroidales bacterium]|nr:hypothetical protein [Bacteroidales bacterium]